MNIKIITANDFCSRVTDGTHDSPKQQRTGRFLITSKHLGKYELDFDSAKRISEEDYQKIILRSKVDQWDILFSMIGTIGNIYLETNADPQYACKNVGIFKMGGDQEKAKWLYYYLQSPAGREYMITSARGTTQGYVPLGALRNFPVEVPQKETREKISDYLWKIDEKIKTNEDINKNLLDQVMALYKNLFIENVEECKKCRADEYFDITIGKTPPRKEHEWFSTDIHDERWVSISDMGNCGLYISKTSEYLTRDAIQRFNIAVVPDNTVILSFKLTIGRLAITDGEMVTNEAIAHFKTDKKDINPYLYCYLKCFNFKSLGSTSSIATAVNSKIIKAMPFVIPKTVKLKKFNEIAIPAFDIIKKNQQENKTLSELRDSLLPKFMSGEIDVSHLDL